MGSDSIIRAIEDYFAASSDDGEFVRYPRDAQYHVIGPSQSTRWMLFTTKPAVVSAALDGGPSYEHQMGLIGRYGLPLPADVAWISGLVGHSELLFLGDMDPVDLMVYAWLRASLLPKPVRHIGVSDTLLADFAVPVPQWCIMRCADSELAARSVIQQVLPNLAETVGPQCAALLAEGRKIELEAIVSLHEGAASFLEPTFARLSAK
jgi:hypothetical protein